jgi:hypothetical protein
MNNPHRWATIENKQWDKTGVSAPHYVRIFIDDVELECIAVEDHMEACALYEAWVEGDFLYVLASLYGMQKDDLQ